MTIVECGACHRMFSRNHIAGAVACIGCGAALGDEDQDVDHRADCTVSPSPMLCSGPDCDAIRLPSEKRPVWSYDPNTGEYYCPTHQKGTTP